MFKNKIYQYFLFEFFKFFLITSLSISILVWITQATRLLDLITEYGNTLETYISYIILIYPRILNNTLDFSFLITIFFLFAKFETSNEMSIYWLSGISKSNIIKLTLAFTIIVLFFHYFLSIFFSPWSSLKARNILANSKFNLVNGLVKQQNFNTPLKNFTIYVEKNDNKGNLKNIFIYEKERTIIAKQGKIISEDGQSYLELKEGITQEKLSSKINIIKFDKTILDFTKYDTKNVKHPKFSERNIFWLLDKLSSDNNKNKKIKSDLREEINKRFIKPFIIIIIAVSGCFLLLTSNEKTNSKKLYFKTFLSSISLIILNQYLVSYSSISSLKTYIYLILLFLILFILFLTLLYSIKKENF